MFKNIDDVINLYFENEVYRKNTDLCNLFTMYGSDKGNHHNYSTFYDYIFSHIKDENLNIFEVGLGTNNTSVPSNMGAHGRPGDSLRGWRDYFKNSMVYGADVDAGCLFEEERIKTFHTDQTNNEIIMKCWDNPELKDIEFDILIDDGLHEYNANRNFFENSIHKLKQGGIYILEDISEEYLDNVEKWFGELVVSKEYSYVETVTLPIPTDVQENNRLGVIVK
jgi:hypothetical protein